MREIEQDLWTVEAGATVITTNGSVRRDGCAVMGRGCALEAAKKWPLLMEELGSLLQDRGNHVMDLKKVGLHRDDGETVVSWTSTLVSFPVKEKWFHLADPILIHRSAKELVAKTDRMGWSLVVLPRPGCGNGGLTWHVVKSILEPILDDRFLVCTQPAEVF